MVLPTLRPVYPRNAARIPFVDATFLIARAADLLGPAWHLGQRVSAEALRTRQRLFLVGGPVRDLAIGRPTRDIDLMLDGPAIPLARGCAGRHGGRVEEHPRFGTAKWSLDGSTVEIASARAERYPRPGCLAQVLLDASPQADLERRDFRLNAMALALPPSAPAALLDPHGGLADLRARRLDVLHPRSFRDDGTRALRAARLAARLDLQLTPGSRAALTDALAAGDLLAVGPDRLGDSLHKLLCEPGAARALALLDRWGVLDALAPGCTAPPLPSAEPALRWLALTLATPAEARPDLARLAPEGSLRPRLLDAAARLPELRRELVAQGDRAALGRLLDGAPPLALSWLRAAAPELRETLIWWDQAGRDALTISGRDLLARGHAPGPDLGRALTAARDAARRGADQLAQLAAAEAALAEPREAPFAP